MGGCSVAGSGREAYFNARGDVVAHRPGTGVVRASLWPRQGGRDVAVAESSGSSLPRWVDAGSDR